jgi:hypothetical protein
MGAELDELIAELDDGLQARPTPLPDDLRHALEAVSCSSGGVH